jgi:transposase InsO family protein/ribonuclease HI
MQGWVEGPGFVKFYIASGQTMAESKQHQIPVFDMKEKSYETYKFELECWTKLTKIEKKRQAAEILFGLPPSSKDEFKTRDYIISKMTTDEIAAEDGSGITTLIKHMDALLRKDDLGRLWNKYVAFDSVRRTTEPINDYIAEFGIKYSDLAKDESVKLPSAILALMLIRRANLSQTDVKLALTGLDYSKKSDLYEQAISALRKYAGDSFSGISMSSGGTEITGLFSEPFSIKQEVNQAEAYYGSGVDQGVNQAEAYYGSGVNQAEAYYGGRARGGFQRGGRGRGRYGNSQSWSRGSDWKLNSGLAEHSKYKHSGEKVNAKNKFGDYYRCHCCGSFRHMLNECPDNDNGARPTRGIESNTISKGPWPVLFTGNVSVYTTELGMEASNSAVLDSACSSTVCGEAWMDNYLKSLPAHKRDYVQVELSGETFRFGGGEVLTSIGQYTIPATLGGNEVLIQTDVVDSHIPLLMSLSAMKRAKVVLYTEDDRAEVMGKSVNLNSTSSGHYCLPLIDNEAIHINSIQECMKVDLPDKDIVKSLTHLHRQFAHPSTEKLSDLLKNANSWKLEYKKILETIYEKCETCKRFKKGIRRPVVALPMAKRFNQVVTMDLKKWKKWWIVYFIDSHSRLCVARRIHRKFPYEVVQAFMAGWVGAGYGIPEEIMFDNGGEFTGEEIVEMSSVLNIKINTIASHSPFSNGLCERNHSVVDNMLEKLEFENPKMCFDDLLAWACTARNAMAMFNGYSPYQIVFGRNPTLPGFDLHPPSTNDIKGEVLLQHLQALNSAKKAFVEADSSERVRRALRHKIRISERSYQPGDVVYYKREDSSQWMGPAKVIVHDGKVVFIRHGSYIVRIYVNRVVLQGEEYGLNPDSQAGDTPVSHDDVRKMEPEKCEPDISEPQIVIEPDVSQSEIVTEPNVSEPNVSGDSQSHTTTDIPDVMYDIVPWKQVKVNDYIMYRERDTDSWNSGKIVSRAGKVSGRNAAWFNIETDTDRFSVNLEKMDVVKLSESRFDTDIEENEAHTEVLVVDQDNMVHEVKKCEKTEQAKIEEIQKLKDFGTFSVVEDMGQERISTRWVITVKEDGKKKARLVARGFEELDKVQSDSPTISKSVMRVFLAICSSLSWTVCTTDIKSAFLQGQDLDRDVFIKPPSGFEDRHKLWKLKKCLYGLNDAARKFYLSVKSCLLRLGCKMSNLEPAFFVYKTGDVIHGVILCHVDDFLHGGDSEFQRNVIVPLVNEFQASRQANTQFKYCGLNISQCDENIKVNQNDYLDNIGFEELPGRCAGPEIDLNSTEYTLFRSLVGSINWLANGTRPDVSFSMINLSTKFNKAHTSHLKESVKIVKMLKTDQFDIVFPKLDSLHDLKLIVFTDASLANLNGVDSCGGHIIFLCDKDNQCSTLAWHSGKLKRIVRSTIAAETMALLDGIEEAMYLRQIIQFSIDGPLSIIAVTDNKSLLQAINSTHLVQEKRLRIDISTIKEAVEFESVYVTWVPGASQLADCLTKKGASSYPLINVITNGKLPVLF